ISFKFFGYYREKSTVCQERYCDITGEPDVEKYNQFLKRGDNEKAITQWNRLVRWIEQSW
ncbi:MAG: hypothetical protein KJO61_00505, partial [Deltaproteobacteria bacterium]|nr:hypothetical protein [Deltaproteobacteria bacterium]